MKKLFVISSALLMFASCKKNDDASAQLEVTMANVAGLYKITGDITVEGAVTYDNFNGGATGAPSYPSDYDVCEKDDTYNFIVSGTVTKAEGATSCTPPSPSVSSSYVVQTSSKLINIPSFGLSGTIESLTSSTLVIKETSTVGGMVSVHTVTLSK